MTRQVYPEPKKPTKVLVEKYLADYNKDPRYMHEDPLQCRLKDSFRGDYEDILLVVVVLNQLYGTNLYDVYRMADYIDARKDEILPAIEQGRSEAVGMIASGHGIGRSECKESVFYSFATKFCHFLNPNDYPIFDSYVEKMLKAYNRQFGFYADTRSDIRDYAVFKAWVQAFVAYFGLHFTFREIDKFLWYYGSQVIFK